MKQAPLKLLLIEDEASDYRLLQRHLEHAGVAFEPCWVADAAALQAALDKGGWDLILTDYTLPDIDIHTRLAWFRKHLPETPVIMVSGTIGEELAVDLLKSGLEDFVSKQNLARLVPAMERALQATALRRRQAATEFRLGLLEQALESIVESVVIARNVGDLPVEYVNPAFEHLSGYSREEVLGHQCPLLNLAGRDSSTAAAIQQLLAGEIPGQVLLRCYRKDGSAFWNQMSIAPIRDREGAVSHYVGIQVDVTEKRRDEERLRWWATVFEHAAEGIFITDAETRILDVNRAFTEILGYEAGEVIGQRPSLWRSGRHDSSFYAGMWQSLRETGQWRGEIWNRHKDGHSIPEWLTISQVTDAEGEVTHYVAVFSDISNIKHSEQRLEHLAHYDPLTQLPNRLLLNARLHHALEHARRNQSMLALLFLDLDRFKNINDSLGHVTGDRLLMEVGARLRQCLRDEDTIARIGGDEFTLLLEQVQEPGNAGTTAEKILLAFSRPFQVDDRELYITPSIGISTYPRDGEDSETLLRNADAAMYRAKDQGRNAYAFYSQELTSQAFDQVMLEAGLRKALERDELRLYYQPQVDMASGALVGAEALVRWQHPDMGLIPPGRFIPLAEDCGIILEIGAWVLETACRQARAWLDMGLALERISVNLSGRQIRRGNLLEVVDNTLVASGLPPEHLELEVLETFIMTDEADTIALLRALKARGVKMAIDDFGTGYSSLGYLKHLPVDRLKIDRTFIDDIPTDQDDMAISRAIIGLGSSLRLEVLAEGVETEAQREYLLAEGCRIAQGYLFSRPLPAEEFAAAYGRGEQTDPDTGSAG